MNKIIKRYQYERNHVTSQRLANKKKIISNETIIILFFRSFY